MTDKRNPNFGILYGPLVRYADKEAERRFRRAVRVQQFTEKTEAVAPKDDDTQSVS